MSWGPQILAYGQQNPWRVFAAVFVTIVLMDLMFGKWSSRGNGGDFDFGGGDGDSGGD